MPPILDRIANSSTGFFRPRTVRDFFAFQLARKLQDVERLPVYLALVERRSEVAILRAFRRAAFHIIKGQNIAEEFRKELER